MKFGFAMLAAGAAALKIRQDEDCYGEWIWEECSWSYYQSDYCSDDCGWWYSPEADDDWSDDYWVSCDEFATWEMCQIDWGNWEWEDDWDTWEDDWDTWEDDWDTWEDDWELDDWDWDTWEDDWDTWEDDWELDDWDWDSWEDDWDSWEDDWNTWEDDWNSWEDDWDWDTWDDDWNTWDDDWDT